MRRKAQASQIPMWDRLVTLSIDDREGMDGGGEDKSAKDDNGGRGWLSAAAMTVDGVVAVGLWFFLWHVPSKIKNGSEFRVSVCVHSVLGCTGNCGNTSRKKN